MSSFRFLDQVPQYRGDTGEIVAGGFLKFFDNNSTTPKNVTNGKDGVSLGAVVALDASGRPADNADPWGAGVFRVRLYAADGTTLIWSRDSVQSADAGAAVASIPAPGSGTDGQAVLTDGAAYYLGSLRTLPDMAGKTGRVLKVVDDLTSAWLPEQVLPTYGATSLPGGVVQGATSFQIGKLLVQFGTGTAPTAAAEFTSVAATFPTAYVTLLHVDCTPTGSGGFTPHGTGVSKQVNGSTTGFTVRFFAGAEFGASDWNITTAVGFTWVAYGLVA